MHLWRDTIGRIEVLWHLPQAPPFGRGPWCIACSFVETTCTRRDTVIAQRARAVARTHQIHLYLAESVISTQQQQRYVDNRSRVWYYPARARRCNESRVAATLDRAAHRDSTRYRGIYIHPVRWSPLITQIRYIGQYVRTAVDGDTHALVFYTRAPVQRGLFTRAAARKKKKNRDRSRAKCSACGDK